jgi:hypothetical protein
MKGKINRQEVNKTDKKEETPFTFLPDFPGPGLVYFFFS